MLFSKFHINKTINFALNLFNFLFVYKLSRKIPGIFYPRTRDGEAEKRLGCNGAPSRKSLKVSLFLKLQNPKMSIFSLKESNLSKGEALEHVVQEKKLITVTVNNLSSNSLGYLVSNFKTIVKNVFLPEGYPHSVSDDYMTYQIWDTIQAFASSISGSLATQVLH